MVAFNNHDPCELKLPEKRLVSLPLGNALEVPAPEQVPHRAKPALLGVVGLLEEIPSWFSTPNTATGIGEDRTQSPEPRVGEYDLGRPHEERIAASVEVWFELLRQEQSEGARGEVVAGVLPDARDGCVSIGLVHGSSRKEVATLPTSSTDSVVSELPSLFVVEDVANLPGIAMTPGR